MSSTLRSLPFEAQLGVIGSDGMSAAQIRIPFTAGFHPGHKGDTSVTAAPYVGKIDLARYYASQLHTAHRDAVEQLHQLKWGPRPEGPTLSSSLPGHSHERPEAEPLSHSFDQPAPPLPRITPAAPPSFPGYRVPRAGRVQLVLRGPEAGLGVPRVLVVPYNVHALSPGTQCIVRHTCYASPIPPYQGHCSLRYAVQLRFVAPPLPRRQRSLPGFGSGATPRVYLFGSIRLAFSPRLAGAGCLSHVSMDDGEQLFRSSQTWGLTALAPAPEPVEPLDPLDALDPLTVLGELDPLRRAPLGSLSLQPAFAMPPPPVDADAFAFSGPGADWTRAASRARAAVRTLRERLWAQVTRPQPRPPAPGPVGAGPRLGPVAPRPVARHCPQPLSAYSCDVEASARPVPTPPSGSLPPRLASADPSRPGAQATCSSYGLDTPVAPVPVDSAKLDHARRREARASARPSGTGDTG